MSEAKAAATGAGATCLLLVGDRVVLRANAPPDAEYAMFEIGEIELRASEPGRVREHGYQTTADLARSRLANFGFTPTVAREFAEAMQPTLSDAYSRGGPVKRVARYLGPIELFQSDQYDVNTHTYRGVFLDLAALAHDLELEHASATFHALYLATVLEAESDETTILLSTDACTKGGKPGARTFKRSHFSEPQRLLNALGGLAHRNPHPVIHEALPRADVIAFLRTRADSSTDDDARALYKSLEGSVALRDMPEKGPLAAPELWAIESRIDSNEIEGTLDAIDDIERRQGRTPGTTYLRARVSLTMHLEPAKLIAERVSALSLSMTSFQELALLAAEAWLDAGDPRRAMPYARDLVDAPGVDEGLLLRAQRLLARAVGAAPQKKHTLVDQMAAAQPSRPPGAAPQATLADEMARALSSLEPMPMPSVPAIPVAPDTPTPTATPMSPQGPRFPSNIPLPMEEPEPMPQSLEPDDLVPVLQSDKPPIAPPGRPSVPPARPSRAVPPPLPSSRTSRAAPPLPNSSSRKLPTAPLSAPPPPSSRRVPSRPAAPPAAITPAVSGGGFLLDQDSPPLSDRPSHPSSIPPLQSKPAAAEVLPQTPPPPLELDLPPVDPAASFTLDLPGPELIGGAATPAPAPVIKEEEDPAPAPAPVAAEVPPPPVSKPPMRRPRLSGVMMETRPPASFDPRAEPDSPPIPRAALGSLDLDNRPTHSSAPMPVHAQPARTQSSQRHLAAVVQSQPQPKPKPKSKPSLPQMREPTPSPMTATAPISTPGATLDKSAHERPTPLRPPASLPPSSVVATTSSGVLLEPPMTDPLGDTPLELAVQPSSSSFPEAMSSSSSSSSSSDTKSFMHGASLPPYRQEETPPLLAKAPLLPKLGGSSDELAEHLALPPGLGGGDAQRSLDVLPTSVLEARVQFTLLSRELGLDYRLKRGLDLRADLSGIEAMQSVLFESFPDHAVKTVDEGYELRRHGALLSEILARRLDAEWLDISPNELGYWVMIVPPNTRVWPFGRLARLIQMGHKERDLVSYFLELQSRSRGR